MTSPTKSLSELLDEIEQKFTNKNHVSLRLVQALRVAVDHLTESPKAEISEDPPGRTGKFVIVREPKSNKQTLTEITAILEGKAGK